MVSKKEVEKQLKSLGFNVHGWGRSEVKELPHIILPGEQIFEAVNGIYDGGFSMLLATDVRILLIDKKPFNYLTVEDLRFDQINEIDYWHRLIGAHITISSGPKTLRFLSFNQPRLRKLINHVQHSMAESKKKDSTHLEGQHQNLERMNEQLQSYLIAQQEQQQRLYEQLLKVQSGQQSSAELNIPEPVKPSRELADYLYAQGLLSQHAKETGQKAVPQNEPTAVLAEPAPAMPNLADLYSAGMQEVFGKQSSSDNPNQPLAADLLPNHQATHTPAHHSIHTSEINPLKVAYSKLPMALRNRRFGRPSFHSHTAVAAETEPEAA